MSRQQRPFGQYRCAVTKLPSVRELGPEANGAPAAAATTTANIAAMMNLFMSASITHHEANCYLVKSSAVLQRVRVTKITGDDHLAAGGGGEHRIAVPFENASLMPPRSVCSVPVS
jgi:hypothetical protein